MATKRFLNVQYGAIKAEIDILGLERIGPITIAIANYYKDSISSPSRIQLWKKTDTENTLIKVLGDIPEEYYLKQKQGGLFLTIILLPSPTPTRQVSEASEASLVADNQFHARKKQCVDSTHCFLDFNTVEIEDLTIQLQSLANAKLNEKCLQSQDDVFFPYPQDQIKRLYVRKCYEEVFELLLKNIEMKSFAISGTPGIGKSLFFVYILYRLVKDFKEKSLLLKPNRIIYQTATNYTCFNLQNQTVAEMKRLVASELVRREDTFYVVDGQTTPLSSSCIVLFISSPRSKQYKEYVKQKMPMEWYFPVWTLEELNACHRVCYPDLSIEILEKRHLIYGGISRMVFYRNYSITVPKLMEEALANDDAVIGVGPPAKKSDLTYTLLHINVSNDGLYQFTHFDIASKYVGEQLWIHHYAQMIINIKVMYGGNPHEISRHLFEIYGHMVFSIGGRTLQCRCLEDNKVTEITLDPLNSQRITFGKNTIPTAEALTGSYYEPTDEDNFPAVDSLSPQGMFQFTVAGKHPIGGVDILRKLSKLYVEPKLYFVVPPHLFKEFKKQSFKGTNEPIAGLKQYVLKLPLKSIKM